MFSLESPHGGDSNVYKNIPFSVYKRNSALIILNMQLWAFFQGTNERVRNSRGKRVISV